ncbi:MAG: alpha-L-fucosidase [Bacteroidales bacterium]|nr:alpha-L-fucosidase [Bacteroidales bacterium]
MKRFHYLLLVGLLFSMSCTNPSTNTIDSTTQEALLLWQFKKFGLIIHWGLYSIPAGVWKGEQVPFYAEQIMNHARIPAAEYELLAQQFNPTAWDADEVVQLAKDAGMKYIVFTTKHHDGFCKFKTKTTNYNVVDATPYGKDVVKELADACQKHGIKLGLYFSLPDWHFEGGIPRGKVDTTTTCREHVNQLYSPLEIITPALEECIVQQLTELLTNYGEIETIWFDMGLLQPEQSQRFRNVVKSLQPQCLVSGRIMNHQGDYLTLPDNGNVVGYSMLAWDNPASMYGTWGYRSWQSRIDTTLQSQRQIQRLMQTISHGGVFLLNIGPNGNGEVIDYEKAVLHKIGHFVQQNQEAIYKTSHSPFSQLNENVCCTQKDNKLYFTVFDTSTSSIACQNLITPIQKVYLLNDTQQILKTNPINQGIEILLPENTLRPLTVVAAFSDNSIQVDPVYISQNADATLILTENNAITHAAFDAEGYISTQADSWKSWNIKVEKGGTFNVFVTYLPDFDDKKYRFSCQQQVVESILPGVDRMLQTAYIGTMNLSEGKCEWMLKSSEVCKSLELLRIKIDKIVLQPVL